MAETTEVLESTPAETDVTALNKEIETLKANLEKQTNIAKEVIGDRDKLKGDLKKISDEKIASSGDVKKQLEAKEKELEEITGKVSDLEKKAAEAEQIKADTIKELMEQLPEGDEDLKKLAEGMEIPKLRLLVKKHSTKSPASVHNGTASGGEIKLTDEQKREAEQMGLSEKSYLEVMESRKKKETK